MIVVAQAPEVVEGDHLQVWPGQNIRQLLADGFDDADSRQLLGALGKRFLLALGLLLWRRLVAGDAVMNVAFLGLAKIEDAASALAVNKNGGFGVGALRFCSGLKAWPSGRASVAQASMSAEGTRQLVAILGSVAWL